MVNAINFKTIPLDVESYLVEDLWLRFDLLDDLVEDLWLRFDLLDDLVEDTTDRDLDLGLSDLLGGVLLLLYP